MRDPVAIADTSSRHHALQRLTIAGGGTGGHVYPAVALVEACRAARPTLEVTFVGTAAGPEARIAPAHGMRFAAVAAAPYYGVGPLGRWRTLERLLAGVVDARRVLRAAGTQLVLGLGGFASAGTVLAARSLGLPSLLFEANATAGLSNRMLARVADRVLLGCAHAASDFPPGRCQTTGIPVRRALHDLAATRAASWPATGAPFRVLVMGGSLGSAFLNAHVPALMRALGRLGIPLEVQHQTGAADLAAVRAAYADTTTIAGSTVTAAVTPFLDDAPIAYERADFAITCAGAGTLAELAAVGLPALVVPLASAARNHQEANVQALAQEAWWTTEHAWDETALARRIADLAGDAAALRAAGARMRSAATPAAATAILEACEAVLQARGARAR